MACVAVPVETRFRTELVTVPGVGGQSTSRSIIAGVPTPVTSIRSICTLTATGGGCEGFFESAIVSNILGDPTFTDIVIPITSFSVSTNLVPTLTVFSSSCSTTSISSLSTVIPTTTTTTSARATQQQPTSTPPPATTQPATSTQSVTLGTPSAFTSVISLTLPNGSLTMTTSVGTTTPTLSGSNSSKDGGTSVSTIVGAVVGGFVGFSVLVGLFWLLWKRRTSRWDDIFDKEFEADDEDDIPRRRSMNLLDNEPKPYQYGIVGAHIPPASSQYPSVHSRSTSNSALLTHRSGHSAEISPYISPAVSHARDTSSYYLPPSQTYPPAQHLTSAEPRRPLSTSATSSHEPTASFGSGSSSLQVPRVTSPSMDEMANVSPASNSPTPSPISPQFGDAQPGLSYSVQRKQRPQSQPLSPTIGSSSSQGMLSPTIAGPSTSYGNPTALIPPRDKSTDQGAQKRRPASAEVAPPPYSLASPIAENRAVSPAGSDSALSAIGHLALLNPDLLDNSPPSSPDLRKRR